MWASSKGLAVALTSTAVLQFAVVIVFLLVVEEDSEHPIVSIVFGHNEDGGARGTTHCPQCSNCQEPRAGGDFSDDGDVYLCPKCLAVHAEYFRVMAKIEN